MPVDGKENAIMMEMHICGYRRAESIIKQLLRLGGDGGAIVEFDSKGDKVKGKRTYVDGVGIGIAVAVVGKKVLDVFLGGGGGVELAILLQCEEDADSGKVNCGSVTGDGSSVLSRLHLAGCVRQVQSGKRAGRQGDA